MLVNAVNHDSIIDFAVVAENESSCVVEPGADADAMAGNLFVGIVVVPIDWAKFRRVAGFRSGPHIGAAGEVGFDGADAIAYSGKSEDEMLCLSPRFFGTDDVGKDVGDFPVSPRGEQLAFHEVDGHIGGCIGRQGWIGNWFVEPHKSVVKKGNRVADGDGFQTEKAEKGQVEKGKGDTLPGGMGLIVSSKMVDAGGTVCRVVPTREPNGIVAASVGLLVVDGRVILA